MRSIKRKDFLKNISLLGIGTTVLPKTLFSKNIFHGHSNVRQLIFDSERVEINKNAIIDMHCHPSLGMYMSHKHFWRRHFPFPGENLLHMQLDLHQMSFGNVRGQLAAHYLPESAITQQWATLKRFYPILNKLLSGMTKKLEHEDQTNYDQIIQMMSILEKQIEKTNNKQDRIKFRIVRSYSEFEEAIMPPDDENKPYTIAIAHAIEGSHALGRNFPLSISKQRERAKKNDFAARMTGADHSNPEKYINNLVRLKERGVCLMSLAHFFKNDLVYPVDGVSADSKNLPGMAWQFTLDQDRPLSIIGEAVVKKMFEIGMIVDLTHCAPAARRGVFDLNRNINAERERTMKCKRPVVFTHCGAQQIYEYYDQNHYPYYKYYDASDEEIRWISECDGVIGILPENFFLVGADTHMKKEFPPSQFKYGIPYMLQTMKYINSKTIKKDYTNISIGTDFDGLADNPADLFRPKQLRDLFDTMKGDDELKPHVDKITWKNALRVLKCGWGE